MLPQLFSLVIILSPAYVDELYLEEKHKTSLSSEQQADIDSERIAGHIDPREAMDQAHQKSSVDRYVG
ncbi:MAG: hypothetical protein M3R52_00560 [Acidobacteriota bacterium]|nr:hypothetical protein [Acidobacteriota bacterium]